MHWFTALVYFTVYTLVYLLTRKPKLETETRRYRRAPSSTERRVFTPLVTPQLSPPADCAAVRLRLRGGNQSDQIKIKCTELQLYQYF